LPSTQYYPILENIGQYPIPQCQYRSNPTTGGAYSAIPDLAGFKSRGRDKGRRIGETTGGDRQLREGTGMREGAGREKGRKRV